MQNFRMIAIIISTIAAPTLKAAVIEKLYPAAKAVVVQLDSKEQSQLKRGNFGYVETLRTFKPLKSYVRSVKAGKAVLFFDKELNLLGTGEQLTFTIEDVEADFMDRQDVIYTPIKEKTAGNISLALKSITQNSKNNSLNFAICNESSSFLENGAFQLTAKPSEWETMALEIKVAGLSANSCVDYQLVPAEDLFVPANAQFQLTNAEFSSDIFRPLFIPKSDLLAKN